jgi:hypothetical protein
MSRELARQGLPSALLPILTQVGDLVLPAVMAQLRPMLPEYAKELRSQLPKSSGAVETLVSNFGFDLALAIAVLDLLRKAWSNLDLVPQP